MSSCVVTHCGILSFLCPQRSGLECAHGFVTAQCQRKLHQLNLNALKNDTAEMQVSD